MITQIYIEGQKLDLHEDEQITIRSSVQDVNDISKLFADFSQSFNVPASDTNNKILSHWYNSDIDGGYDARTRKQATVDVNTLDFKRGKMRLDKAEIENGKPVNYRLTFFGDVIKVKDLIGDDKLFELDWLANFNHTYSEAVVLTGLTTGLDFTVDSVLYEEAVIYPLISYKRQYLYNSDASDTTSTDTLVNIAYDAGRVDGVDSTNLKPAIRLSLIIQAITEKYGIVFTGNFFNSSEFSNIYMNLNKTTESIANGNLLVEDIQGTAAATNVIRFRYLVWLFPKAGFESVDYKIKLTINDQVVYESSRWLNGDSGEKQGTLSFSKTNIPTYDCKYEVITKSDFEFDTDTDFDYRVDLGIPVDVSEFNNSYTSQVISLDTNIINELPDIKVYKLLTDLFKMFNSVITPDGEDIEVNDLQSWYSEGQIYDITQYVNTKTETVSRGKIFKQIDFKFEESDQILADEFLQSNKQVYGNLEFKLVDASGNDVNDVDGDTLEIEVLFENPIFERLFDLNDNTESTIQYCLYTNRELKSIAGNPFLFYAPSTSVVDNPIGFLGSSYQQINTSVYMPSHSLQIDTESFNLNFNAVVNEYTSQVFQNTIYKNYYEDYITDIFSIKRRMHDFKAILPNNLLNKLRLNDRLIINDRRYIQNAINSNIVTRGDDLNLINDIYDAPLASDVLSSSLFLPTSKSYNSSVHVDTTKYVGVIASTIAKVDTGYGTSWLTVTETVTTMGVQTINYSMTQNTTGADRTVQIQVTDSINDPKFTIYQSTVFIPSLDFNDFRNSVLMQTILIGKT